MYLYLLPKFAIIYKNSKGGFLMRIYNWLNKNKDSENILIQLLRLIYTVEISTPVHVILSSIIGIFIPLLISKHLALSIILLIIFVLGNILHFISEGFHTKNFEERKFAKNILADQSSLINSMGIIINTDPHWKNIIFKEMCEKKYGKEGARERIVATTDREKGALKKLATDEGYVTFVVPDDIGGRYSVLTAVGLFPIAMAGIDIDEMLKGAKDAMVKYNDSNIETNDAYRYGVARQLLNKAGYSAEMFVTYELQLNNVAEWWKQLYGESEGKENKGILPHSAVFSTDLHSLGQFIQEGSKVLYETIFEVKNPQNDMIIPSDPDDLDGLNYLAGKSVDYVNKRACEGTIDAHVNTGNVPNIIISLDKMDAYGFGYMVYFFEMSCAMSVYFLGVNPFNQPGVEVYKKNMFKLLGKPGY